MTLHDRLPPYRLKGHYIAHCSCGWVSQVERSTPEEASKDHVAHAVGPQLRAWVNCVFIHRAENDSLCSHPYRLPSP